MSQINPFAGVVPAMPGAQRQQEVEKSRQLRRQNDLRKNSALGTDERHDEVESADAIVSVSDQSNQQSQQPPKRDKEKKPAKPAPQIDLTA